MRRCCAGLWAVLATSFAAFALLKPSPAADDLVIVTPTAIAWLNENDDFRTFVMTVLIVSFPFILLADAPNNRLRRGLLVAVLLALLLFELSQSLIPSRFFSWWDVAYTIAGVAVIEFLVVLGQRVFHRWPVRQSQSSDQ